MIRLGRSLVSGTGGAAGVTALLLLVGCSAADRALLTAPRCRSATSAPQPAPPVPGTVYAWRPHFESHNVPGGVRAQDPGPVPGWTDVVSIAGSGRTTFAVKTDGTVWAYGLGHLGMLGDGDLASHLADTPQRVEGITDARSVHVVGDTVLVVRADSSVLGWGGGLLVHAGRTGTLHDNVATPVPVDGLADVVEIAPGDLTALALRGDGTVAGWGMNLTAMLGDQSGTSLTTIDGVEGIVSVASTGGAALAATADGAVCAWGNNVHGVLGVEPTGGQTGRPVEVPGLTGIVQVAGGRDVAYALDSAGAVWAWGRGASGALGDGNTADHVSAVPAVVAGLPPTRWIGAFGLTGLAVDTEGGLWGWGSTLALGPAAPDLPGAQQPVRIPLPGPVLAVSGGHAIVGSAA
jgi:regulator of chromosome condensation